MTDIQLSRRQVLAGLGTIGIASAGAGLGTTAFFSDEESLDGSLEAGRLDLLLDYRVTYNPWLTLAELSGREEELFGGNAYVPVDGVDYDDLNTPNSVVVGQAPDLRTEDDLAVSGDAWADLTANVLDACAADDVAEIQATLDADGRGFVVYGGDETDYVGATRPYVDGEDGLLFDLTDVKPKDEGEATISVHLCDNRGYVSLRALPAVDLDRENEVVEPEATLGDDDAAGELANYIWVQVWFDDDCSNTINGEETPVYQGSLAGLYEAFAEGGRLPGDLDGGCFSPGVHCLGFYWYFLCTPEDFARPSDVAGSGGTVGGELDALGLPRDVNVAQTDREGFSLEFTAVQCRHNMGDVAEFADIVVDDQEVLFGPEVPLEDQLGIIEQDLYGVLTVASVTLPEGGYAVVHDGAAAGPVIGYSNYLGPGTHLDVPVVVSLNSLDLTPTRTVYGMAHRDDPADQAYDFPTNDPPYLDSGGNPVVDPAELTIRFQLT
jgi:predicted ribosomally synthesized peptide with SipW-like signal peptide